MPGILEWSGRVEAGRSTAVPCSTSDYFPTVAAALGLDLPSDDQPVDAISLLALVDGRIRQRGKRIAFQTPDRDERGKQSRPGSPDHALIGDHYKFLAYLDPARIGEDMLFDLAVDPGERHNLVAELPGLAASMNSELMEWDVSCSRSERGEDYGTG